MTRREELRTGTTFAAIAAVLWGAYYYPKDHGRLPFQLYDAFLEVYAHVVCAIVFLIDASVRVFGHNIRGRYSMRIDPGCDAMTITLLYVAAVLATPARLSERAEGAVLGVLAIFGANVARLCVLYALGLYWPAAFEPMHVEWLPLALTGFAFVVFVWWTRQRATA